MNVRFLSPAEQELDDAFRWPDGMRIKWPDWDTISWLKLTKLYIVLRRGLRLMQF